MTLPTTNYAALLSANSGGRLLVADDEPTILELPSGSLRLAGFDVVTAASGEPRLIHTIRGLGYILRIPPP
jgi:DNA-binding response OmpR family regulator